LIAQIDNVLWHKTNALVRNGLARLGSSSPYIVVTEYPKSGGTWISMMLSDALAIPFPRNRLPMLKSCILHDHLFNPFNIHNVLAVTRDGRDILVSQYFHSLFENGSGNEALVRRTRKKLNFRNYDDLESNLPAFIEYTYSDGSRKKHNWNTFNDRWTETPRAVRAKYEDFLLRPVSELQRVSFELSGETLSEDNADAIVKKYSFSSLSGRKSGEENKRSFLRKGISGDWKNYFTPTAKEVFKDYAGATLIKLGYESDNAW